MVDAIHIDRHPGQAQREPESHFRRTHQNGIPAFAGMTRRGAGMTRRGAGMTKVVMLATFILLTVAACGRKDVPDYPPDAIERPGVLQPRRDPIRYY